jgi:hypothetical protein
LLESLKAVSQNVVSESTRQDRLKQHIMQRFLRLKNEKAPWNMMFDFVSMYVLMRMGNFSAGGDQVENAFGNFLPNMVFDSTATRATYNLSSSLIGNLFPSGGKTFQLLPPLEMADEDAQSDEVKTWYEQATLVEQNAFDDYEAGFQVAQTQYFNDEAAFGTCGIGAFDDDERMQNPIHFEAIEAKRMWIAEGKRGNVDTVYRVKIFTAYQLEDEYGLENLAPGVKDMLSNGGVHGDDKIRVLIAIEPRRDRIHGGVGDAGNDNYPIASVHIDLDHGNHILRESGYTDMPIFVARFWQHKGEVWGRSPATQAMPDIMELNSTRQASIVAIEKYLDPPLYTWENSILGGGVIDTTAGAVTVAKQTGRAGQKPIEQLIVTGELTATYGRMNEISEIIDEMYYSDKLSSLGKDTRITLGEAEKLDNMRKQALTNVFVKQITELYIPLIGRVFNMLWIRNRFGFVKGSKEWLAFKIMNGGRDPVTIPNAVIRLAQAGSPVYRIQFLSPAARILRQEELNGIMQLVQTTIEVAPVHQPITDIMNWDRTYKAIQDLSGASTKVLNSAEEIQQLRNMRAQQQQAQIQAEMQSQGALTAKHAAQAQEAAAKAGVAQTQAAQAGLGLND